MDRPILYRIVSYYALNLCFRYRVISRYRIDIAIFGQNQNFDVDPSLRRRSLFILFFYGSRWILRLPFCFSALFIIVTL